MNPQFTYDSKGNAVGVFLPIDDWNQIKQNMPVDELPQWQKEILDNRMLQLQQNPNSVIAMEDFIEEMNNEADEKV